VRQVQLTRKQLEDLTGAQARNTTITGRFAQAFDNANRRVAGATRSLSGFQGLIATLGVGKMISETIQATDQYASLQGQLALVTDSQEELNEVYDRALDLANRTGQSTDATINLYARLARSTEELEMSQNDLFTITEAINQSFIVSGASAQESSSAILQLSQGLAAGALRGEELNSVMENSPRLARAIADGLGVTIGQLRAMGAEGELTAERVTQALLATADTINTDFQKMPMTIGRVWQAVTNDLNDSLGQVETGELIDEMEELRDTLSSPEFKESITTLAESLLSVATNSSKALTSITGLTEYLGEQFAATLNGVASDDLVRIEEQISKITELLDEGASIWGLGERIRFFDRGNLVTFETTEELIAKLAQLHAQAATLRAEMESGADQNRDTAESQENLADTSEKAGLNLGEMAAAQREAEKAAKDAEKAQKEYEKGLDRLLSSLYPAQAETRRLRDEYLLLTDAISRGDASGGSLNDWIDANLQIEVTARRVTKETKLLKDEADPLAVAYERGLERMDDGFAEFFKTTLREGKVTFDGLKNIFLDTLGEMIYAAARNRIMVTLGVAGGSSSAMAGGGMMGTGTSSVTGLSQFLGGSVSGMYQTIGTGLSNLGATGLGDMAYNAGLRYSGLGGTALGIGGGILGGVLGNKVFGSTSGIGSTLGGIAGGMLIPIPGLGTAIGSFLGTGLESLFNQKPSDKRQYASGAFGGSNKILTGFSGDKFSKENQSQAAALLGEIQRMAQEIGGTTAAGSVSVGGRTGFRLSTGQGEDSFRTFADADALLDAAFREVLAGATSLAPAVKTLAQAFNGGREQALAYTQSMQGLWQQTKINPVTQAIDDFAAAQGTAYSAYRGQADTLRSLVSEFDGSTASATQLTQALAGTQQVAYQLTQQFLQAQQQIGQAGEASARSIREAAMTEQQLRQSLFAQRKELRESFATLTDPGQLQTALQEALQINQRLFQMVEDPTAEQAERFASTAESLTAQADRRIDRLLKETRQESQQQNVEIRNMLKEAAAAFEGPAITHQSAADTTLEAAERIEAAMQQFQRLLGVSGQPTRQNVVN
jgi:tape measure domain-containing protein